MYGELSQRPAAEDPTRSMRDEVGVEAVVCSAPMRARLHIPDEQMPSLDKLSLLEPEILERAAGAMRGKVTVQDFEAVLRELDVDETIAQTLVSLAINAKDFDDHRSTKDQHDEKSDFVTLLTTEFVERWAEEAVLRWRRIEDALRKVLAALVPLAKSIQLQYQHANVLLDTQLVTDIRPVMDSEGTQVLAGIICHTLQLEYRGDGRTKKLTLALDSLDLEMLRKACERAGTKEQALKSYLAEPYPVTAKTPGSDAR